MPQGMLKKIGSLPSIAQVPSRVSLFCGHYGSGKTNIAVNYAMALKAAGADVTVADLDIVNPYFRTKDSEDELVALGIDVISLQFANTSVDLPSLPSSAYSLVQNRDKYAVLDIGGDDRGAYALGRYVPSLKEEQSYDMLYVVNFSRPLTKSPESALEVMREIEQACGLSFTAIINNTNIGEATDRSVIDIGKQKADELSRLTGLPIFMTTVKAELAEQGEFPLSLQKKYF